MKDSTVLVYYQDGIIVGVNCIGVYAHERPKGAILFVREIAVHPKYQNQGIGKMLLQQGLYYGKLHGARRAFLFVDENNKHAINLYEKIGFIPNGEKQIDMIKL